MGNAKNNKSGKNDKSAKPGTEDAAGKKDKSTGRPVHPHVGNEDQEVYPFSTLPGDFDFGKHKALKKKDFIADHQFFSYRADELRHKADEMTAKAEEAKVLGSTKDRAKAKRLRKMQEKMAELRKSLEEDGVDVDALLAV